MHGARLWLVDLDVRGDDDADCWLSPSERSRAARFVYARDATRFRAGHAVLRQLLSVHDALTPRVEFRVGPFGKPSSGGRPFNVSDSGPFLLIGIGSPDGPALGVDLELLRPIDDHTGLARHHFSAAECASLQAAKRMQMPPVGS